MGARETRTAHYRRVLLARPLFEAGVDHLPAELGVAPVEGDLVLSRAQIVEYAGIGDVAGARGDVEFHQSRPTPSFPVAMMSSAAPSGSDARPRPSRARGGWSRG